MFLWIIINTLLRVFCAAEAQPYELVICQQFQVENEYLRNVLCFQGHD
jgi:hypothetical protein